MKTAVLSIFCFAAVLFFSGCAMFNGGIWNSSEIEVRRAMVPVVIDGKVTDEIWTRSKYYPFVLPDDRLGDWLTNRPEQEGMIQVAYDDNYVYLLVKFIDDDLVQYGEDGTHLYSRGDTFEFFLRNPVNGHYWEIYGTPNSKSTVMFYENGGKRIFPEAIQQNDKIKIAAVIDGTLNDSRDTDKGCVIEMAIPMSVFNSKGDFFKPGTKWEMLGARYNYSKTLYNTEFSCTSEMPKANWHDREHYLPIVFR